MNAARLLPALVALALAGCRSAEDLGGLRTHVLDAPEGYELLITGNSSFLRGTLQRAAAEDLRDFEERDFARAPADDAAYSVESYYRSRGFPKAEVDYRIEETPEGRTRLVLEVDEGPRVRVRAAHFAGATVFTQAELAARIGGPTSSAFGLGDLYYVEGAARAAASAILSLYDERGYLDAQVSGPTATFEEDRDWVTLDYVIDEGRPYVLREVRLVGLDGEEELARARAAVAELRGRPFQPRLGFEARSRVGQWFTRNGYPDAHVIAEERVDSEGAAVDLVLTLNRGELVHLSGVRIEGNEHTREAFLRQRIGLAAGELYDRGAEQAAFGALYATGLFRSIRIDLEGQGPERELVVRVEEIPSLSLSAEVGYGAFERARVLLGLTEENLLGTGRSLSLEAKLAERAQSLRLFLTDPWTLGPRNILGATSFFDLRQQPGFDRQEVGVGVNLTRPVTESFRNVFGYEYRFSDATNIIVDTRDDSTIDDGGGVYVSELYVTNLYDSRDSVFLPTRGTWARLRTELAPGELASTLTFARVEGRLARYHGLSDSSLLAWTVSTGLIFPIQDTVDIPLQERYFNGGQNSVRSFRQSELGPKDAEGDPIGGETYFVASVELRRRLPGSFTGALFVDAGNVGLETGDYLRFADVRYAVGPGLRWLLPIGPLRLDWGINPSPRPDEADWVLQFSVGVAF